MPSIVDKFLEGGEIRRKREQAEGLAQRQQQQLGIQQQDADMRLRKDNTRRFFGGVNELKLLSDQGDWNGVMRVTQDIAQIDPRFAEGSEMISTQLANMDFDGVKQSINNSYQLGLDNGLINDPRLREAKLAALNRSTGRAGDFERRTKGLTSEEKKTAQLIDLGLSPRAVGSAVQTIAEKDIADLIGNTEATIAQRKKFGELTGASRVKRIDDGIDKINKIRK